jgi:hypothetical protein
VAAPDKSEEKKWKKQIGMGVLGQIDKRSIVAGQFLNFYSEIAVRANRLGVRRKNFLRIEVV